MSDRQYLITIHDDKEVAIVFNGRHGLEVRGDGRITVQALSGTYPVRLAETEPESYHTMRSLWDRMSPDQKEILIIVTVISFLVGFLILR